MSGFGTDDVIEWRPSPWWALEWLALMVFVGLPFIAFGGWLAAHEIGKAVGTVPTWYSIFCYVFVGVLLGALAIGVLIAIAQYVRLLFDPRLVLRADRNGFEARTPDKPMRGVRWQDISAIEIERTRQQGRKVFAVNQLLVRFHDERAPELTLKPQMAGISLEDGHAQLNALYERLR